METEGSAVGAPAFMRGKERFSAPGKISTLILRFSAGNALLTSIGTISSIESVLL
jgi:hypothetical protein